MDASHTCMRQKRSSGSFSIQRLDMSKSTKRTQTLTHKPSPSNAGFWGNLQPWSDQRKDDGTPCNLGYLSHTLPLPHVHLHTCKVHVQKPLPVCLRVNPLRRRQTDIKQPIRGQGTPARLLIGLPSSGALYVDSEWTGNVCSSSYTPLGFQSAACLAFYELERREPLILKTDPHNTPEGSALGWLVLLVCLLMLGFLLLLPMASPSPVSEVH